MSPAVLVGIVLAYFALLFWVARRTGHHASNEGFFVGNRQSPWLLVAFGMVGTTLSGVTFVSVPGAGHILTMEQPAAVAQLLLDWLLELPPTAGPMR